jgi:isopentenyl-diphosphate delta-isomerase
VTNAHQVVSSEAEELILVDANDDERGFLSKAECHDGDGVLHRAFSVFLFNESGKLLLQQRSAGKRLWPGYWSNTCCSHPRRGESMQVATQRRLMDELHIEAVLQFVYKFTYQATYNEIGSEHELCHVYLGRVHGEVTPNRNEIEAIRYESAEFLDRELATRDHPFTPWFRQEWRALRADHAELLLPFLRSQSATG